MREGRGPLTHHVSPLTGIPPYSTDRPTLETDSPDSGALPQRRSPKLLQPNRSEFDLAALAEQSEVSVQFTPAGETFVRSHSADKRKLDDFIGGETNQGH